MHREVVIQRVMTKFTQIPQSSEELRICFKKDTRRNGIMTSLVLSFIFLIYVGRNRYSHQQYMSVTIKHL